MFFCVQSKLSAQLWVFKTYELDYGVLLNIPIEISSQPMQIFIKSNKYLFLEKKSLISLFLNLINFNLSQRVFILNTKWKVSLGPAWFL